MGRLGFGTCLFACLIGTPALAVQDVYKITATEKAACTADAIRYCAYTYPDEMELVSCMKSRRSSLSPICLTAFDAGLRRRHMN